MEPFYRLQNIRHRYNGRLVLDIPELRIEQGSITGLAGPNGSGKSTLLRILGLTEPWTEGIVLVEGTPAHAGNSGRSITLLPQEAYLLRRTVFDNIAYGLRIRGRRQNLQEQVKEGLALVGLAPTFAARKWHELSGGEAQRVALAARLVLHPACLLLDEPTASVDMKSGLLIQQAVLQARAQWGATLVIASHQRPWLHDICDHLLTLYNGRPLTRSLDNLLIGPWSPAGSREWRARLADGQFIFATRPPTPESSGVLPPASLYLTTNEPADDEHTLQGTVTGVSVDKHLPGLCLHVNCGGMPLLATAPGDDFALEICRPGQKVLLRYLPDAVIWLD
ncbi:MAG: energy-coupling factor ABC transporter ATP-binding protein [Desulfobulbaceae bacterium]|jgi:tungstate transport system ATP-binding protein